MTKTTKKNERKQPKKAGGKKKDPGRVAAAMKAWETIREKQKEKQVTS